MDNGQKLRELIERSGVEKQQALVLFNEGQARPLATRTFKTYLAHLDSKTRVACPDGVLQHMQQVLEKAGLLKG